MPRRSRLNITTRRAFRRLLWAPNELGFARAYVSGDIEVDGDLVAGTGGARTGRAARERSRRDRRQRPRRRLLKPRCGCASSARRPRRRPRRPGCAGRRHSKRRDAAAIAHHYDVGNDFYRIVLGESMTYSCAYWAHAPRPTFGAGRRPVRQVRSGRPQARPERRHAGARVGCGWGTFALHAARTYGARVVGVTLSHEQADYARKRMADEGVTDLVEIRVQDYRDVDRRPVRRDLQHRHGRARRRRDAADYAADLFALLRPQGRLLNHAISRRPGHPAGVLDDVVHRSLRVPRRRARAAGHDGRGPRGRRLRGARRRVAARALRADAAGLGRESGEPLGRRGRG